MYNDLKVIGDYLFIMYAILDVFIWWKVFY